MKENIFDDENLFKLDDEENVRRRNSFGKPQGRKDGLLDDDLFNVEDDIAAQTSAKDAEGMSNYVQSKDPENDGKDYTEAHNKKAYAKTRELLAKLTYDAADYSEMNLEENPDIKQKIEKDIDDFIAFVKSSPAIHDHFSEWPYVYFCRICLTAPR